MECSSYDDHVRSISLQHELTFYSMPGIYYWSSYGLGMVKFWTIGQKFHLLTGLLGLGSKSKVG